MKETKPEIKIIANGDADLGTVIGALEAVWAAGAVKVVIERVAPTVISVNAGFSLALAEKAGFSDLPLEVQAIAAHVLAEKIQDNDRRTDK